MTCKHITSTEQCELKWPSDGSKYPNIIKEINDAFMEAAENSPHKLPKLGVGCGSAHCCFVAGKYATWKDCPYFENNPYND